jgi:hypothetical protein
VFQVERSAGAGSRDGQIGGWFGGQQVLRRERNSGLLSIGMR